MAINVNKLKNSLDKAKSFAEKSKGSSSSQSSALQSQKDKNSAAWHQTTDQAERDRLHQENVNLQGQIDKITGDTSYYNDHTGKWHTYDKGVGSGDWIGGNGAQYNEPSGGGGSGGGSGSGYRPSQYEPSQYQPPQYQAPQQENLYEKLLEEQQRQYAEIKAQQEAAKRAAVEQAVGQLGAQKGTLEQNYADLYRQLYIDRRMSEKSLPQQLAAMGYSGGLTESTALALQTKYGEALRQGEQAKLGTMNSIDQAIQNARLTGDISIADMAAQTAREQLASYGNVISAMQGQNNFQQQFGYQQFVDDRNFGYNQFVNDRNFGYQQFVDDRNFGYQAGRDQVGDNRWNQQFGYQQFLDNRNFGYQVSQDGYANDREKALYLAGAGNFGALGSLWGMSDTDVQSLTQTYAQQNQTTQQQAARDLADWYAQYGDFSKVQGMGVNVNTGSKRTAGAPRSAGSQTIAPYAGGDTFDTEVPTGGTGAVQVDMGSVLALGMGPLSADQLADMEDRGIIRSYVDGGKIRFVKTVDVGGVLGYSPLGG